MKTTKNIIKDIITFINYCYNIIHPIACMCHDFYIIAKVIHIFL